MKRQQHFVSAPLAKSGIPINTPFKLFILMDKTPPQLIACEPPNPLKSLEEAEIHSVRLLNVSFPYTGLLNIELNVKIITSR